MVFFAFHKEIEDLFSNAFRDYPELKETYDDVLIIHNNNLFCSRSAL
jgi:cell division GTPase FtsZ